MGHRGTRGCWEVGVIPLGLSFLPQDTRRLRAENADPRLGSRNSPWYRLGYCQHLRRGPSPCGELSPGPGPLHPCSNHPFQPAFLDPVPPSPPALAQLHQGPCPPSQHTFPLRAGKQPTHPQISQGMETVPRGTKRSFFLSS